GQWRFDATVEGSGAELAHRCAAQRGGGGAIVVDVRRRGEVVVETQERGGLVGLGGTGLRRDRLGPAVHACSAGGGSLGNVLAHAHGEGRGIPLIHHAFAFGTVDVNLAAVTVVDRDNRVRCAPHATGRQGRGDIGQCQGIHGGGAQGVRAQVGVLHVIRDGGGAV